MNSLLFYRWLFHSVRNASGECDSLNKSYVGPETVLDIKNGYLSGLRSVVARSFLDNCESAHRSPWSVSDLRALTNLKEKLFTVNVKGDF